MDLWEELNGIFRKVFENPAIRVEPQTTAADVDGWDSLSHVNLILAVESHFNVRFSQKEILRLRNVGDLANLISSKQISS